MSDERNPSATRPAPACLIDAGEAAEILSVSREWVLAQARAGRIPHVRLGRYVRFEQAELEAWWHRLRRGPDTRGLFR